MYGQNLRKLRNLEGWTQEQVANKLGVSKQTYSHYENEKRKPGLEMILKLGEIYDVNIQSIFNGDEYSSELMQKPPETYEVGPVVYLDVVGSISCGNGTYAYQDIEGQEATPRDWLNGGNYFYLRAKGDSMIGERIMDGDLLLIRQQDEVENGEIAVVIINDEAVLKKVTKTNEVVILESANPKYPTKVFSIADNNVRIIGKLKQILIKR
jgi:repressor LexA